MRNPAPRAATITPADPAVCKHEKGIAMPDEIKSSDNPYPRPLPVLRALIDSMDRDMLQLLSRRYGLVAEIAAYKRDHRLPIRDFERERVLLEDRRTRATPLGLSPELVESLFRLVLWGSRDRQAALKAEVPLDIEPRTVAIIGGNGKMGRCMSNLLADLGHAVMLADLDTPLTPRGGCRRRGCGGHQRPDQ